MLELSFLGCRLPLLSKLDPIEDASVITIGVGGMRIPIGTSGSGTIACSCVAFDTLLTSLMEDLMTDTNLFDTFG